MAALAYAKAIFAALVLEGLRAGVWQGVGRGAERFGQEGPHPSPAPVIPALEAERSPAPPLPLVQWQCPPCPECPACPGQFVAPPVSGWESTSWSALVAASTQCVISVLVAGWNHGCGRRRAPGGPRPEGPDLAGEVPRFPALPPAPRPGQLGILE